MAETMQHPFSAPDALVSSCSVQTVVSQGIFLESQLVNQY